MIGVGLGMISTSLRIILGTSAATGQVRPGGRRLVSVLDRLTSTALIYALATAVGPVVFRSSCGRRVEGAGASHRAIRPWPGDAPS
jgi:hypothetical protein